MICNKLLLAVAGKQHGAEPPLVANRIYAAFNVLWEPSSTRLRTTGQWQQESVAAGSAALTAQLRPGLFVGVENLLDLGRNAPIELKFLRTLQQ